MNINQLPAYTSPDELVWTQLGENEDLVASLFSDGATVERYDFDSAGNQTETIILEGVAAMLFIRANDLRRQDGEPALLG